MTMYRKKPAEPTVFEAAQWWRNGDHPEDYVSDLMDPVASDYQRERGWEGHVVRYY